MLVRIRQQKKRLTALLSLQNVKDVEPMSQRQGATILTAL